MMIPESAYQQTIIDAARAQGFLVFHPWRSRRSEPGFVDLVMVSQPPMLPRLIFAECKSAKGKLTPGRVNPRTGRYLPGQQEWLDALEQCTQTEEHWELGSPVEVYLWRLPQDLDAALGVLRHGEGSLNA